MYPLFSRSRIKPGRLYKKSLLLVLLIMSLPTAFIGIAMNVFGIRYMDKETTDHHQILLEKTTQRIEKSFSDLEMALPGWLLNPSLTEPLVTQSYSTSVRSYQDLNRLLIVMQNSFPLIDRIYIYLADPPVVISNEEGYVRLTEPSLEKPFSEVLKGSSMYWKERFPKLNRSEPQSIALINTLPFAGANRYGAVITYIKGGELNKYLSEMVSGSEDTAYILDSSGNDITSEDPTSKNSGLRDALTKAIQARKEKEASFIFEWQKNKYSVSYTILSRLGLSWTLVAAMPLTKLTAPVILFSRINIAISLVGIITAILLSWFASKRMYSPIRRLLTTLRSKKESDEDLDEIHFIESQWQELIRESSDLQERLNKSVYSMREGFLMQLVQGYYYALTESELRERMQNLGWDLTDKAYVLLFFQLHGLSRLERHHFQKGDEQLVSFAAGNIVEEIVKRRWPDSELLNFQDLTFYVWIPTSSLIGDEELKRELHSLCDHMIMSIQQILRLYMTIVIGRRIDTLRGIAGAAEETRQAVRYRDFEETNQILDMENVLKDKSQVIPYYPLSLENEIIHSFRMGNEAEATSLFEQFIHELQDKSGIEIQVKQGLLKLFGSVHHAIMLSDIRSQSLQDITTLYGELLQLNEQVEILKWFSRKVITPYMWEFNGAQDAQMRLIVEKVVQTVQDRYMEDISLDSCADSQAVFASSLSLAFKKKMGMNFIDFLTQYRLDKAKKLLTSTDLMISEVAERVGYQPSYFNRLFKKIVGVTPGQFRENAIRKTI